MSARDDAELGRASRRLALQFAALILVLFAGLGVVTYSTVVSTQNESLMRTLESATNVDSPHDVPPPVFMVMVSPQGTQSSPFVPDGLPDQSAIDRVNATGAEQQDTLVTHGRTYALLTTKHGPTVVQAALDLHEQQGELQRLVIALLLSGLIATIAAGAISVLMSRRAMRPLTDALALQRRFVADASHELRTPLTLLSLRAQLLRRRIHDPELATGMDEILQDSRALAEILEDLLIAADPRETAEVEPIDLVALATEVVRGLQPGADERSVALRMGGSSEGASSEGGSESGQRPVLIQGARVSLQRLITALVDNALDHAASTVTVSVDADGGYAVLRVTDDGPGFPEDMDDRAFERFASSRPSSDETRTRHYGLGLSLVAEVAARHNGTVKVGRVDADGGADVVVRIPIAQAG